MNRASKIRYAALAAVAGTILAIAVSAQTQLRESLTQWPEREFEFARLHYYEYGSGGFGGTSWRVDYPYAEFFFHKGVSRLSRVDMGDGGASPYDEEAGVIVDFDDDSLFNFPWLYAVEVGYWQLNDREAEKLREYLLRGGFLMVDDFHGPQQWAIFLDSMKRVFPNRAIVDIEDSHEILHVVYDVDDRIQIPGIRPLQMGVTYEYGGIEPHWRGIYDDDGRLMVIINHNMDLGDAWEHADDIRYPQEMTTLALHFAVNYVIYAMTH